MIDPNEIEAARRALGRLLAKYRNAAGLNQRDLAPHTYYGRSTIANVEVGRQKVPREFWERCDQALNAGGRLLAAADQLEALVQQRREETARLADIERAHAGVAGEGDSGGLLVDVSEGGAFGSAVSESDSMSPLTRRLLMMQSIVAAAGPMASVGELSWVVTMLGRPDSSHYMNQLGDASAMLSSWAMSIYEAVLDPLDAIGCAAPMETDGRPNVTLDGLRQTIVRTTQASLSSDHRYLAHTIPILIGRAESARQQAGDANQADLVCLLSDIFSLAGWALIKADIPMAAWVAAQRAVRAAEHANDLLRLSAATRCLAEVYMRAQAFGQSTNTAFLAGVHLEGRQPRREEQPRVLLHRGAALLSAAAAAARHGDTREAYAALKAAAICGEAVGADRSDLGVVFGPTNVAIHRVAIALELGNSSEALRHVPTVSLDRLPAGLAERRGRFLIDVARSYGHTKNDSAAIGALLDAETIAPAELRGHRLTHQLLGELLARERRSSELRALAARCDPSLVE